MSLSNFLSRLGVSEALRSRYIQALVILAAAGMFLRFFNLTFNSIWLDEAATYEFSKNSFLGIWDITANGEFNPPLFHWIEHFMLYFGKSELVLRFIPAILGSLTIPLFYVLGTEMYDRNVGIISASVLTFSPFHVFYSQDARAYTTVLFFFSIALLFFFLALKTARIAHWVWFGFFSALSFWTHFYVLIAIGVLYAYAIYPVGKKGEWEARAFSGWILSILAFLVATLPLLIVTFHLFLIRTAAPPTYGAQGFDAIRLTFIHLSGYTLYLTAIFLVLFSLGLLHLYKTRRDTFILSVLSVMVTLIASYGLSFLMPMIPRYLICMLPFYFVPVASSCYTFSRLVENQKAIYLFMAFLIVVCVPQLYIYNTKYSKEDWRGLAKNLEPATNPGDVVVAVPQYLRMPLEFYYSTGSDGTILTGASNLQELQKIPEKFPNTKIFYLVTPDISATDPSGASVQWLARNATYLANHGGIFVYVSGARG